MKEDSGADDRMPRDTLRIRGWAFARAKLKKSEPENLRCGTDMGVKISEWP